MTKVKFAAAAAAVLLASTAASAATYTRSFAVGSGTIDFSATTDGTIGVLSAANFSAYSLTMTTPGGSVNLNQGNSLTTFFSGTALSATATQLIFDFNGTGHIQVDNFGSGGDDAFCIDTPGAQFVCVGNPPSLNLYVNSQLSQSNPTGQFVLGNITGAAVPEPESWALLIVGFMAVGAGLRRRTAQRSLTVSMA